MTDSACPNSPPGGHARRGRRGRGNNTSPRRLAAVDRAAEALALRKKGETYTAIAAQLGFSDGAAAHKAVSRALAAVTREPALELIELEASRLDELCAAIWDGARRGDLDNIDAARKLVMDRAKLLGIVKNRVEVETPPPREALWARVREWLDAPTEDLAKALHDAGWRKREPEEP